jgi:hypothetical protein
MLIRADSGGGTHGFLAWLAKPGRRLAYSAGFTMTDDICDAISKIPAAAWTPAHDSDRQVRSGAWIAELTGLLDLSSWPKGMRVIARKERPHPGPQLRFADIGGHMFTCFATSTRGGQLADLELCHRRRPGARTGSAARKTPACATCRHGYAQNQIWGEIVALACDLLAWMQMLALPGPARRWESRRLRLAWIWPRHPTSPPPSPACTTSPLADPPPVIPSTKKGTPRDSGTPTTLRDSGATTRTAARKKHPSRSPRPPSHDHERCRLARSYFCVRHSQLVVIEVTVDLLDKSADPRIGELIHRVGWKRWLRTQRNRLAGWRRDLLGLGFLVVCFCHGCQCTRIAGIMRTVPRRSMARLRHQSVTLALSWFLLCSYCRARVAAMARSNVALSCL